MQATRLTRLSLAGPETGDEEFFFSCLSDATQLRNLQIAGWGPDGEDFFLSADHIADPNRRNYVVHNLFGPALAALSRLTRLSLTSMGLSEAPGAPTGGLALLPRLRELDLSGGNEMKALPVGP